MVSRRTVMIGSFLMFLYMSILATVIAFYFLSAASSSKTELETTTMQPASEGHFINAFLRKVTFLSYLIEKWEMHKDSTEGKSTKYMHRAFRLASLAKVHRHLFGRFLLSEM
uniref:Uncharacterized protein n=1 Tax=Pristionchus pacificus TaxID=54126 RepID=A0A2A6CH11_PRIPA|eukprot:PDM77377.1 hypothetical protein PRIPAC_33107 [Pristionchus pacificus]